jgi:hypothetical protein
MFAPAESNNTNSTTKANFEKAAGFVNMYLPSQDGGRSKLGAVPLKSSNMREKALFDALVKGDRTDEILEAIKGSLILEFNVAEQSAAKNFDIGIKL